MGPKDLITCQWGDNDTLRTSQTRPTIVRHPRTGDEVWSNRWQAGDPLIVGDLLAVPPVAVGRRS